MINLPKTIALGFSLSVLAAATEVECVVADCRGLSQAPSATTSAVDWTIIVTPTTQSGNCYENCTTNPCSVSYALILENDTSPAAGISLWVRGRLNGDCVPGVTQLTSGQTLPFYASGEPIACGTDYDVHVYTADPGAGCAPGGKVGGFGFSCSPCVPKPAE